ncbi:MAG: hypothetical protein P4L50_24640 [Anaerolineaceae bacterium]|nr:hypothetical protein [Anaerolineaceae bacterium]
MINFQVDAPGMSELLAKLAQYDSYVNRRFTEAMQHSVDSVVRNIKPLTPVGVSSMLRNSIGSEITTNGPGSITGKVGSSMSNEIYPSVMEFGRTPGAAGPPWQALVRWVHLKQITGTYSIKTNSRGHHNRRGSKESQQEEDEQAAKMIALAIHRKGIKGRHFMQQGFEKSIPDIQDFFATAIEQIVQDLASS